MSGVAVRHGWVPGVVGEVVRAHAVFYAREWSFGPFFEAKVAREMGAFLQRYDPAKDRLFRAEDGDGRFLGALAVDGGDSELAEGVAHLRWFIAADGARGRGVGGALMRAGLAFLAEAGFRSCHLTTFAGLDTARRLYEGAGFVLAGEAEAESWGTRVAEQRFALDLAARRYR
ncbi:MAG: GNAT family N-acetyltransferase [Acetobacteraceae bacterium]|nr:GNAT family N-acetyltransferase [Acetobacteraceae bacterium]